MYIVKIWFCVFWRGVQLWLSFLLTISVCIFSARRKPTCRCGEEICASTRPWRYRLHRGNRLVVCLIYMAKYFKCFLQMLITLFAFAELEKLRQQVVGEIKSNQSLESDLNQMDIKIGLLVKNRITLQVCLT